MIKITNKNGAYFAQDEDAKIENVELSVQKNGWCKLPEGNTSNRTWIKGTELLKIGEGESKILPYKTSSIRTKSAVSGKTWVDFLSEEDKKTYEALKEKGEKARNEAKTHKLTDEEKETRTIAKLEAKLAQLKANQQKRVDE